MFPNGANVPTVSYGQNTPPGEWTSSSNIGSLRLGVYQKRDLNLAMSVSGWLRAIAAAGPPATSRLACLIPMRRIRLFTPIEPVSNGLPVQRVLSLIIVQTCANTNNLRDIIILCCSCGYIKAAPQMTPLGNSLVIACPLANIYQTSADKESGYSRHDYH